MSFDAIQKLIKSDMGLAPESVGAETIKRVVTRRMKTVGMDDVAGYVRLIKTSVEEKQHLINEVTVPETWFFRDHEPFNVLADYVRRFKISGGGKKINILSVPCSTGEEPYSIAMVLRDAGLGKNGFGIDAVDISTAVLEKARKGVYSENSFRGKDVSFRDRYFEKEGQNYHISAEIKTTVNFAKGNIVAPGFMAGKGPYDVVFCRNLLIYFDYQTKCDVLDTLHGLMADKGMLVLGHAETGRMPTGLFETLNLPGSFAYLKSDASRAPAKPVSAAAFKQTPQPPRRIASKPAIAVVKHEPVKAASEPLAQIQAWVDSVQQLADEGRLKQALTECDKLIAAVPDSAQGYYLKGLVLLGFDADEEAMTAFKKAVYLDPKHYQSLIHLSVLAEEQGELRAAENFRARADRLRDSGQLDAI